MNRIPTFMSEITQPGAQGITAQTITGSTKEIIGASKNTRLSAPAGTTISLTMYFRKSAKRLHQAPGPDHVRPAAQLHRRPDLAVGVHQEGEADEHEDVTTRHCARIRRKRPKPG